MQTYLIAAFYKFVSLEDYQRLKKPFLRAMNSWQIKGTIILAKEGINGTICGEESHVNQFFEYLNQDPRINPLNFNTTWDDTIPFSKAKIKLRQEIVTMGIDNLNPEKETGVHVDPLAWNDLIRDKEVLVIDTRNEYEVSLGSFENAINPDTIDFRNFPDYVEKHLLPHKNKKIAMFCTGGIRCEKSTAYLRQQGFNEVYQLQGGILNYMQSVPEKDSLWKGACFIFDDRMALDYSLKKLPAGFIDKDWKHKNRHRDSEE